jgi:hypothetical protein
MFGSLLDFVRGSESLDGLDGVFLSAGLTALRVGAGRSCWKWRSGCGTPLVDCPTSSVEAGASCRCWTVPLRQMPADVVTFA